MAETQPLIVVPSGALSKAAMRKVERAGYVVVESDAPDAIRVVRFDVISSAALDGFTLAALETIAESQSGQLRGAFANRILKSLLDGAREAAHD